MDKPVSSGGLWNCARPIAYSQKTQELLKMLMQETHFANGQKRQIRECLKNGAPLHLACVSKPSSPHPKNPCPSDARGPRKSQKRSMEQCKSGASYVREKFIPGPTRDREKEKQHLQNILERGKEAAAITIKTTPSNTEAPEEKDPFDKIMEEIEERQKFLEDMASFGKEQPYVGMINFEISQRIKELELLDTPSKQTSQRTSGQKLDRTEEKE